MKFFAAAACLLVFAARISAQTNDDDYTFDVDSVLDAAETFASNHLDDSVLAALQNVDRAQVTNFFANYQDYLQGDYVLDVAQLKDAANFVLPLLDANGQTQPYAAWLRARLDYFDVAQKLKAAAVTNAPATNALARLPNPPYATEQIFWNQELATRPPPAAARLIVPQLERIFVAEQVPAPLVWIAEVESDFDARARSPAGAVGLFQLMPATAKELGLRLWPFDQRKQVAPSARAAAKYLRQLHDQFADWRLAVAAYNCGPGRVRRALQEYPASGYAGIAAHLPAETQLYVPKVAATVLRRAGVTLENL